MSDPGNEVSLPLTILRTLLEAQATASAHHNLCGIAESRALAAHPGDDFGRVLGWLWLAGRRMDCVVFVSDFFSEMREHSPALGQRLTWDELKRGLVQAIDPRLSRAEVDGLLNFLDDQLPKYYGRAPKRLNEP